MLHKQIKKKLLNIKNNNNFSVLKNKLQLKYFNLKFIVINK